MKLYIELLVDTEEICSFDNLNKVFAPLLEGSSIKLDHVSGMEVYEPGRPE